MADGPREGSVRRRRTMSRNQRKRGTAARRSPKRNNAPTSARPASPTLADLQEQVSALTRELAEAREQQTATSEVLRVISSSPGDLESVFQAMLENATRICGAKFGSLVLFEGNSYRRVALHNAPAAFVEAQAKNPVQPLSASPTLGRAAATKEVIQVEDIRAEQPKEAI